MAVNIVPTASFLLEKILGFLTEALNQGVYGVAKVMGKIHTLEKHIADYVILVECYLFISPFQVTTLVQRALKLFLTNYNTGYSTVHVPFVFKFTKRATHTQGKERV